MMYLKESHIAIIALIGLLALTAIATTWINYEKTLPGYDSGSITGALSSFDKITLGLDFLLAAFLFVIAWKAARRTQQKQFMLVGIAFAFFTFKILIEIADKYFIMGNVAIPAVLNLFDLAILALLFTALMRK
ncbi:MAG: hypothetical protein V1847_05080 [Candidatus Diapherotrites archaeon]